MIEQQDINLVLPWPPSVNQLWRTTQKGNWYVTKAAKDFKGHVWTIAYKEKAIKVFQEPAKIEIIVNAYPPDDRKRDIDNLAKVLFDSLQDAGVFEDDSQIKKMTMEMKDKTAGGKLLVTLRQI